MTIRRVASCAASTVSECTTNPTAALSASTTHSTAITVHDDARPVSLDECLASPSPRCCACNTRGGYRHTPDERTATAYPSDQRPSTPIPADSRKTAANRRSSGGSSEAMGDRQASTASSESGGANLAAARKGNVSFGKTNVDANVRAVRGGVDQCGANSEATGTAPSREEQLVDQLEECLSQMTNLRDWLRFLYRETDQTNNI